MLNEIQEAYDYIYDYKNAAVKLTRLKWGVFTHNDDLNGLERILTTISRYFIFEDPSDTARGRRRAEAAMRMWLGFTDGLDEDERFFDQYEYLKENYPWLDHWLYNYLKDAICNDPKGRKERFDDTMELIKSKKQQLETKSLASDRNTSDYKLIRFDKILSNAQVARGPLKKYYLAYVSENWKAGTNKVTASTPDSHIKSKDDDKVLKLLAAYLLERRRKLKSNNDYVFEPVNFSDIAFWAAGASKLDRTVFKVFTYEDSRTHLRRPLFEFRSAKSGNLVKTKPDEEWMGFCGWEIIEATDNDYKLDKYLAEHPGAVFFSDPGASQLLRKNERYVR